MGGAIFALRGVVEANFLGVGGCCCDGVGNGRMSRFGGGLG